MRLLDVGAVFLVEVLDRLMKDADERLAVIAKLVATVATIKEQLQDLS